MTECKSLLPLKDEIIFAREPWRCNLCECADISEETGQWILLGVPGALGQDWLAT